ncbi:MAG: hydantoinase/oxoprolinase family protein [Alphaproteobacteria bacterium]
MRGAAPDAGAVIGVDIGGTFTDIALEFRGRRVALKVLTTPRAPDDAIVAGISSALAEAGAAPADVRLVIHGTTLLTNALIERRGRPIAFLTTAGHRDTLEIATESRFHLYDLNIVKPEPLVPREWRLPVRERLHVSGQVLEPLAEDDVRAAAERIARAGLDSVAIGFLHAYANPVHERRAAEILRARLPRIDVTLASETAPEIREYERFNTACANAILKPIAGAYLRGLSARLAAAGIAAPLFLMHSGGGLIEIETALAAPIRLLESGPAGGVIFAAGVANALGLPRALCFDMGGTTAKICVVDDGRPRTARQFELDRVYRFLKGSGLPLRIPVIELVEIGAGGGSIAKADRLGGLAVGPESAGAEPGPACFARGGAEPTVTDADVVLGRIRPEGFAGGSLRLDPGRAAQAVSDRIAAPLGLDAAAAARGIGAIVDENMANAARMHAQELGRDLRDYALIAFGGAGPLHAASLAKKLGIKRVVIPADAGVGSAVGFLRAPLAFEVLRSRPERLDVYDASAAGAMLDAMKAEAMRVVERARAGAPASERTIEIAAFMRYVGQGHEVEVALAPSALPPRDALREAFEAAYAGLFRRRLPGHAVEILSWRVRVAAPGLGGAGADLSVPAVGQGPAGVGTVWLDTGAVPVTAPIHARAALAVGAAVTGPAIVVDRGATILVPAGAAATVAAGGHLVMTIGGEGA